MSDLDDILDVDPALAAAVLEIENHVAGEGSVDDLLGSLDPGSGLSA